MENEIKYQGDKLLIKYRFQKTSLNEDLNTFFDWLGDFDIVTAYELQDDFICSTGELYRLSQLEMTVLIEKGEIILEHIGSLTNHINMTNENERSFLNWYEGN